MHNFGLEESHDPRPEWKKEISVKKVVERGTIMKFAHRKRYRDKRMQEERKVTK